VTVASDLVASLGNGGKLIVSGFLAERADSAQAAIAGIAVRDRLVDGEWVALAGTRADELS
jgi:ribosomal protein L11 methylase PrmA